MESDWATIPEHRRGSSTVLIVDDHQDKRHLLACILQKNNFSVLEAENGSIALSMLEDLQPDVVLLDVLMPELDGFEVCRRMKRHPKIAEIPVLFVTVLEHEQNRVEGLELGGEDFINWPINASELVARINARIRSHRPLHELRTVVQEQNRLLDEERQREAAREYELEQARLVQQRFIAGVFPEERGLSSRAVTASGQVGGDLFDVVPLNTFKWRYSWGRFRPRCPRGALDQCCQGSLSHRYRTMRAPCDTSTLAQSPGPCLSHHGRVPDGLSWGLEFTDQAFFLRGCGASPDIDLVT